MSCFCFDFVTVEARHLKKFEKRVIRWYKPKYNTQYL